MSLLLGLAVLILGFSGSGHCAIQTQATALWFDHFAEKQKKSQPVPTSHGALEMRLVPEDDTGYGHYSIFRRGRLVVDGRRPWAHFFEGISVDGVFDFPGYSVVVFEGSEGSRDTRPSRVALVVTRRGNRVVRHRDFREAPGDFATVRRPDGVILDFGFRARTRRAFLVNRHGLMPLVGYRSDDDAQLTSDQCETLRDIVRLECVEEKPLGYVPTMPCTRTRVDPVTHRMLNFDGTMWAWRAMRWVKQHPAFEAEAFRQRCELACRTAQAAQALDGFGPAVCHRAPSTTQGAATHPPS